MQAALMIPSGELTQEYALRLDVRHGQPVLLSSHGQVIDAPYFKFLRDRFGARIETDDLEFVAKVLQVVEHEPGLIEKGRLLDVGERGGS